MRVAFEWTEKEWREALKLAERKERGTPLPGLTYALILIPLIGSAGNLFSIARRSKQITLAGSIVPLLLALFALTALAFVIGAQIRRRVRRGSLAQMPPGQWEAVLQEAGWRVTEKDPGMQVTDTAALQPMPVEATPDACPETEQAGDLAPASDRAADEIPSSTAEPPAAVVTSAGLRPWSELTGMRRSDRVVLLMRRDGFDALPTGGLSPEQGGHMHRMITRKLKPAV